MWGVYSHIFQVATAHMYPLGYVRVLVEYFSLSYAVLYRPFRLIRILARELTRTHEFLSAEILLCVNVCIFCISHACIL